MTEHGGQNEKDVIEINGQESSALSIPQPSPQGEFSRAEERHNPIESDPSTLDRTLPKNNGVLDEVHGPDVHGIKSTTNGLSHGPPPGEGLGGDAALEPPVNARDIAALLLDNNSQPQSPTAFTSSDRGGGSDEQGSGPANPLSSPNGIPAQEDMNTALHSTPSPGMSNNQERPGPSTKGNDGVASLNTNVGNQNTEAMRESPVPPVDQNADRDSTLQIPDTDVPKTMKKRHGSSDPDPPRKKRRRRKGPIGKNSVPEADDARGAQIPTSDTVPDSQSSNSTLHISGGDHDGNKSIDEAPNPAQQCPQQTEDDSIYDLPQTPKQIPDNLDTHKPRQPLAKSKLASKRKGQRNDPTSAKGQGRKKPASKHSPEYEAIGIEVAGVFKGQLQYYVKWDDEPKNNTWEPSSNFDGDAGRNLLSEFWKPYFGEEWAKKPRALTNRVKQQKGWKLAKRSATDAKAVKPDLSEEKEE